MWNVIASNRLTEQRNRQKQYIKHRKTLSCIKSQINNLAPPQFQFLSSRPKQKHMASERHREVQLDNEDLVRRMIKPKSGSLSKKRKLSRNSLHSTYFKHMAERIEHDNAKLVERLHGTTACVNFDHMENEHQRHLKWKEGHKKRPGSSLARPMSAR